MSQFSDYVTNVGFRLELSKAQLRLLSCYLLAFPGRVILPSADANTERALVAKGLLIYTAEKGYRLTEEALLLFPLLAKAGLIITPEAFHPADAADIKRSLEK